MEKKRKKKKQEEEAEIEAARQKIFCLFLYKLKKHVKLLHGLL